MALVSGTQLGTYTVTSLIGAGGMGEVYQAHDSKLGRDVAIKVLPEQFARDPERLARFQREAKMLAALNHPNIAAIYGLEQSGDTHYLVMELVPGETLRERVAGGRPVPVEEALTIAKQIAEALEAAHGSEKGIIHRDLKPANVKVTPEGRVKVLDFGLAKAFAADAATEDPSNSPTLSMNPTMQGVIMGTAAYMSPEQARGKAVTKATDIFAFGAVLYELLTGKQAFHGEDVGDILATVVKTDPDWKLLPEATPATIRTLLRRCLRKERHQRLQDAASLRILIEEALAAPAIEPAAAAPAAKRWLQVVLWSAASSLAVGVLAGIAVWNLKPSPPPPVSRSVFSLPPGDRLARIDLPAIALAPDGSHMVYAASRNGTQQLYLRAMDSFEPKPLPGTEGAIGPFFSPDGQWIGFFAGGNLKKISINGGAAVSLSIASVGTGTSATWGSDDTIVFQTTLVGGLWQVSAAGGTPKRLNTLAKGETSNRWPQFLPTAKAVLFAANFSASWITPQLALYRLDTGERRNLILGTRPYYSSTGHLLYVQGGTLMAVPFDLQRMEISGTPVPMVEDILQSLGSGMAQYSISENGSLAYLPGGILGGQSTLVWVDRKGAEQPLPAPAHSYRSPRVSPDGKRVAVVLDESGGYVWIYDLARQSLTRLTFEANGGNSLAWMRDGKKLAFGGGAPLNLFWQAADGSGKAEPLSTGEMNQRLPTSWSPDGQALAYMDLDPATNYDIWVLRLSDPSAGSGQGRKAQLFLRTAAYESAPQFSPDGRWLAYVSDESGRFEIYVQPYPGPGGKYQISVDGGTEPVWNPSGRELFYRSGGKMMAVDIAMQPSFSAGRPRMLFERPYLSIQTTIPSYDVSPDGQRFLMLKPTEQTQATTQINIVQNWFEELKQRAPTGKQ
jgi:eukaryotic-like serine/threonine-protein kinase